MKDFCDMEELTGEEIAKDVREILSRYLEAVALKPGEKGTEDSVPNINGVLYLIELMLEKNPELELGEMIPKFLGWIDELGVHTNRYEIASMEVLNNLKEAGEIKVN